MADVVTMALNTLDVIARSGNGTVSDYARSQAIDIRTRLAELETGHTGGGVVKLVPVEPTAEMRHAGERAWMNRDLARADSDPVSDCYRAMLAAVATSPATPVQPIASMEAVAKAIAREMHKGGDFGLDGDSAYASRPTEFLALARAALASLTPAPTQGDK